MKKFTVSIILISAIFTANISLRCFGQIFPPAINLNSESIQDRNEKGMSSGTSKAILFDQVSMPSGEPGILSQEFPDFPPNTCQAADDFEVPSSEIWIIEGIQLEGDFSGIGMVEMVNIFLYMDEMGHPGPELFFMPGIPVMSDPEGNLEITIIGMPALAPGTYWISVQAFLPGDLGEWRWLKQEFPTIKNELCWQNPGGGLGGPFFWESASIVWSGMNLEDWNLGFKLTGIRDIINLPPFINGFYPQACFPGRYISLYGQDLGTYTPGSFIIINGLNYHEDSWYWNNDTIVFELPFIAGNDSIDLQVQSEQGISNTIRLGFHYPTQANFEYPYENEIIYSDTLDISVVPETFMEFIEFTDFYYRFAGEADWNLLGTDTSGASVCLGSLVPCEFGDGWAYHWDISNIDEDTVQIKAEMTDKFGQVLTGHNLVYIDKTPIIPFIDATSKLNASKAIADDSLVFSISVTHSLPDTVKVRGKWIPKDDGRILDTVKQYGLKAYSDFPVELVDQVACGPCAGASCLKWLAKTYAPASPLNSKDVHDVAREMVKESACNQPNGANPADVADAINDMGKSAGMGEMNKQTLTNRKTMIDSMVRGFNAGKDVLMTIWQKDTNGVVKGHMVTMSSYHYDKRMRFTATGPYYYKEIKLDFMDPKTGKIDTFRVVQKKGSIILQNYKMKGAGDNAKAIIAGAQLIKPKSSGEKESKEDWNDLGTIPVNGAGLYSLTVPCSELDDGLYMIECIPQSDPDNPYSISQAMAYITPYRPVAWFTAEQNGGKPPVGIQFANLSFPSDSITYFKWDFGDGDTSNLENPLHTYLQNGIYDVSLIVSDGSISDTIVFEDYIRVGTVLDLHACLEGSYSGTVMETYLNPDLLPNAQPYFISPWFYPGTEEIDSIPSDAIVDWMLIELRETPFAADSATGSTVIARQACLLRNDGQVVSADGLNLPWFDLVVNDNLFAVLDHRNHLGLMNSTPIGLANRIYSYDFTAGSSHIYGGTNGAKEVAPGVWGLIAGDGFADGQIDNRDKDDNWLQNVNATGYLNSDFDLDGEVRDDDIENYWIPNSGCGAQIPD